MIDHAFHTIACYIVIGVLIAGVFIRYGNIDEDNEPLIAIIVLFFWPLALVVVAVASLGDLIVWMFKKKK